VHTRKEEKKPNSKQTCEQEKKTPQEEAGEGRDGMAWHRIESDDGGRVRSRVAVAPTGTDDDTIQQRTRRSERGTVTGGWTEVGERVRVRASGWVRGVCACKLC
jgi:hypothetical protein